MAQVAAEVASESVEAVEFGVMTDEEVKKLSVRNITNSNLINVVGRPEPGGLYDPALGPFDDHSICKTCGQRSHCCPGHFGHIDLVSLLYHPLLFNMLYRILQSTCLAGYHFLAPPDEVQLCIAKLNLIRKGDVVRARELDSFSSKDFVCNNSTHDLKCKHQWTSFQLTEAHSVLHLFLKKRSKKCHCGAKNSSITKPMFAWLHKEGLKDNDIKANVIRGHKLDDPLAEEDDEKSMSEVDNATYYGDEHMTSKRRKNKKDDIHVEFLKWRKSRSLLPTEVRAILERLWENEAQLCSFICDIHQLHTSQMKAPFMMFFIKALIVPPLKFRPPARAGESVMEHPQTVLLGKVLDSNLSLANAHEQRAEHSVIVSRWMNLQQSVNVLFDSKSATGVGQRDMASGICQLLEKKEGMFRQKMMGKRVNFACRSVISPDPYLAVNEIGIPPVFALKLTYPERVTPWNVTSLRDVIVNGPDIHPGATHYVDKMSTVKLPPTRKSRIAFSRKLPSSRGVTTQPGKIFSNDYEGKVVQRHLRNGDIVLVNRQPTLHKPSIIALKVRVLPGERTIRFHYANCDSFNADFDGDEINVHFPQDEISRAEAYNIVNADNQYIVPTRGDPKRALIQDHIVGAVLLTKRDTFLTLEDFTELLYMSGICSYGSSSLNTKIGKKISIVDSETFIQAHPPAIVKPERLWTGKQVITAILNQITRSSLPFTVKKRAKIAREYFGRDESKNLGSSKTIEEFSRKKKNSRNVKKSSSDLTSNINKAFEEKAAGGMGRIKGNCSHSIDEDIVFVYNNELVQGIIDKEQFGKYGLVHTVQELYGSDAAGKLLSVLSRVLTAFLQMHGFTCGVHDLLLQQPYDKQRKKLLQVSLNCGEDVHHQFIGHEKEYSDFSEMQFEIEKAIRRNGESAVALLDGMMRSKLNTLNSAVTKLFPEGLIKPFRKNCLSLMTLSGAKGGTFNFQQISLLLGQQELEGKRVPRMVSGKTLPCFVPWDSSARAGGFISDRYLTGLRPQEFYFHCMAGREGLVDTAVKTSRSGYLQRCLIKNLECLTVHYDYTIRDADGSIIQFRYGEDGVDVHKKNYMQEFEALALNRKLIVNNNPLSQMDDACVSKYVEEDNEVPNQLAKEAKEYLENNEKSLDLSNFLKLVRNKYYMSLAQPGEPVGIIAAQSIGEPSTQMTLNTFHHAGRGEMNVTLGIPRLQEILMTASVSIKTPTMTCPLLKSKTKDDADQLASKLKRITVADLIENMEVSIVPFSIEKNEICSIYKLKVKLYDPELYPPHTNMTLEDCHRTLQDKYLEELEAAIEKHLLLLSRIAGIKSEIQPKGSDEMDGDGSESKSQMGDDDDDDDGDGDDDGNEEGTSDLGSQKNKRQARDEVDYDDESDEETEEGLPFVEVENEVDLNENDGGGSGEDKMEEDLPNAPSANVVQEQKVKPVVRKRKKNEKSIYVSCEGLCFEVHFKLIDEPHILLAQIAEKAAKKVYVKSAGKIEQCKVVELLLDDSGKGGIPMLRKGKESRLALQTAGVDFSAFWGMQDELDVRFISSNDINAMLNTYGVEAARATIVAEVFTVFGHYGVTVDMRHLSLIADFMTQTGGYRPLSRTGGISESISPLGKMSYETASKFLTEAAIHGEVDNLETPSSRICLGLPAKVGTGCFDLMHVLDV